MRCRAACILLAALLGLPAAASSAVGTAPGRPGLIAYFRNAPPCHLDSEGGTVCRKAIWTSGLDGSGERRLTPVWGGFPAWSPDGRRIAHVRPTGPKGVGELWVMNADGGSARKVLAWSLTLNNPQRPSFNPETAPSWTPDGTSLVLASALYDTKKGPQPTVVAIPVKGGPPRRLFALPRATNASAGVDSPQLSPNGRLVAFLYGSAGSFSLYVARPDGSHRKRLSAAYVGYGRNLDWSPDGRRIVFLRRPDPAEGGYADLYVVKADGTALRRLTTEKVSTENLTPAWSPDGSRIIFKSGADSLATPGQPDGIENRFAVINADGTDLHLVGPGHTDCGVKDPYLSHPACYASDPSWQPR